MKKSKLGFTLIEVALFLAISGLLFIGITIGVQNSIYQQRKNDSVQNFIEFLRNVYSEVSDVQNWPERGRSDQAIYGKLVTFGESVNLNGASIDDKNKIFAYTVMGDIMDGATGDALSSLADRKPTLFKDGEFVGYVDEFTPKWGARIERTCNGACSYEPLTAALLIFRHPGSGTIYTYYKNGAVEVNKNKATNPIGDLNNMGFSITQADFCVNPTGERGATDMVDVRILSGARNASAIEQVPTDSNDNKCRST